MISLSDVYNLSIAKFVSKCSLESLINSIHKIVKFYARRNITIKCMYMEREFESITDKEKFK